MAETEKVTETGPEAQGSCSLCASLCAFLTEWLDHKNWLCTLGAVLDVVWDASGATTFTLVKVRARAGGGGAEGGLTVTEVATAMHRTLLVPGAVAHFERRRLHAAAFEVRALA